MSALPMFDRVALAFTAYGVPAPQGSTKAFMRPGMKHPVITADCKRTKPWRQASTIAWREELAGRAPIEGSVDVELVFYLPRPKTAPRRVLHPAKKPDLDKLQRAALDALTSAGAWRDDSQVVDVVARKRFAGGVFDPAAAVGVPRATIGVREGR